MAGPITLSMLWDVVSPQGQAAAPGVILHRLWSQGLAANRYEFLPTVFLSFQSGKSSLLPGKLQVFLDQVLQLAVIMLSWVVVAMKSQ